jgi:hypothetical protein
MALERGIKLGDGRTDHRLLITDHPSFNDDILVAL